MKHTGVEGRVLPVLSVVGTVLHPYSKAQCLENITLALRVVRGSSGGSGGGGDGEP